MNSVALPEILESIYAKLAKEITAAFYDNTIDEIIEKYGLNDEIEYSYYDINNSKILVLGDSAIGKDLMLRIAKSLGIPNNRIEFGPDYVRMHNFNYDQLRNSFAYSDVLIGPVPHKGEGIGKYSSFLAMAKANPSDFPKIIELEGSNELKITKRSFSEGLKKTRLYNEL